MPDQPVKQGSFFSSSNGMFVASVLLMAASAVVALAASIMLSKVQFQGYATDLIVRYLAYGFSIVLGMTSVYALIASAVRCGTHGPSGAGSTPGGEQGDLLTQLQIISDRMLLSDTAKRIAYRQEDVNALREAISDDIARKDFDAGLVLVQEMSQTFGYREEAEEFRDQIMNARRTVTEARISTLLSRLDQLMSEHHDYDQAMADAMKIMRLYPESPRVADLDRHVLEFKEAYKHQVERDFLAAAQKDDVEGAIELLKTLDHYLTEREAEPFREIARGVIGKKRDNLGVQYKMAIQDKEWLKAIRVGEQLIREFPNTRMAQEARDYMDALRERAAGQQAAEQSR
jgi:tetratricopeptide (TPR) repeat protein